MSKTKRIGFFQDTSGDFSVMRLIFFVGFIWLFVTDTYLILDDRPLSEISTFTGVTGTILAGLKAAQKKYEQGEIPQDTETLN